MSHTPPQRVTRPWTKHEDQILRGAVSQFNQTETIDWHKVASNLPRRNNKECRKRWVYSLESKICKGPWEADEDLALKQGVAKYGLKWAAVAEMVGSRQPDQCSRRWHEVVNPRISHERWSLLEDEILKEAVDAYGRKWTEIVERFFVNRTPISARNRYKQRFENRNSASSARHSSTSSDEQRKSSLLWTIQDHSQKAAPSYEPGQFVQMPPASAGGQWSAGSSVHGSASPHSAGLQADFGQAMTEAAFSRARPVYSDQAPYRRDLGADGFAGAFQLDMDDLLSEPDQSSFESTHTYPSPLGSGVSYPDNIPVGAPHFEPFTYGQAQQPILAPSSTPSDLVFNSPDSYMAPPATELTLTDEETRRLMSARAQMRQSVVSGGGRQARSALNPPSMAY